MTVLYLTAYNGAILGPIARLLGWIMNWIYIGVYNLFHVDDVAVTIIVFTIFIYICLFPLTYQQQKFSMLQRKMSPELKKIQDKYKGKRDTESMQAQQEETQALYDKYGVSTMGSCIQLLIQMPILFALYRVFYNIPAYITSVKGIFTNVVTGIMSTDGYAKTMQKVYDAAKIGRTVNVDLSTKSHSKMSNYIIDILYKLSDNGWDSLHKYFPHLSDTIASTQQQLHNVNYLFNLNISDTPWNLMKTGWAVSGKDWALIIAALLVPVASYVFQFLTVKLQPTADNGNDQMAAQMKTMNLMMPLMSFIIAFTVPVGLVLYWIVGSIIRCVQQVFLNRHFEKMDLDEIVEKNKEKAAKKAEKRGQRRAQIYQAATTNTRSNSMAAKANISKEKADRLNQAEEARKKASRYSISAKANLVEKYNAGKLDSKDNTSESGDGETQNTKKNNKRK